ncbi:MAG: MBL fold metallo-hydrolase [Candidatus Gracilibacteria bacterium]|jgi:L-ascorbate metabolism protein UlaG (beta-lactamase superfamily)
MEIIWHGYGCLSIKTKDGIAIINPYKDEIGLKLPNIKANVVLTSNSEDPATNNAAGIGGEPKVLSWPGEYEVAGIAITAQELNNDPKLADSMVFTLDADGLKVCYLTNVSTALSDEFVENIGQVDVLIVPVSGNNAGYKEAHAAIEEIEPRAVVPMRYMTPGLKLTVDTLDNFAKQAGIASVLPKDKFVLNAKSDLSEEKTEFVILNPITA